MYKTSVAAPLRTHCTYSSSRYILKPAMSAAERNNGAPDRRDSAHRHPKYYVQLRKALAAAGRTAPLRATSTQQGLASVLKKWERYDAQAFNNENGAVLMHPQILQRNAVGPQSPAGRPL